MNFTSLITKTNMALNSLRAHNPLLMYDDGEHAMLMYQTPIQTGGGMGLQFPRWDSLQLLPEADYHYQEDKFYTAVQQQETPPRPLLYAGLGQTGGGYQMLWALKSQDPQDSLMKGMMALDHYPEAEGLKSQLPYLNSQLGGWKMETRWTQPDDLLRVIDTAKQFSQQTWEAMEQVSGRQTGGAIESPAVTDTAFFLSETEATPSTPLIQTGGWKEIFFAPEPARRTYVFTESETEAQRLAQTQRGGEADHQEVGAPSPSMDEGGFQPLPDLKWDLNSEEMKQSKHRGPLPGMLMQMWDQMQSEAEPQDTSAAE